MATFVGYDVAQGHLPGCQRSVWDHWLTFERAPTGKYPSHTRFMVLTCESCRGVVLLPRDNFELVAPEFRRRLLAYMHASGWNVRLVEVRR